MPQSYDPTPDPEMRQRVRDQLYALRDMSDDDVSWDTDDPADHNYLFVPGRVLMRADVESDFVELLGGRRDVPNVNADNRDSDRTNEATGLVTHRVPEFSGNRSLDVRLLVDAAARALGRRGAVTPEHYVHVAPNGSGNSCPATEPTETGFKTPWPPKVSGKGDGSGVTVAVVDCGWVPMQQPAGQVRELDEYDGHGPFAEEIIRTQAPNVAQIVQVRFPYTNNQATSGIASEVVLSNALGQALAAPVPQIISMSAGSHTYDHQPLLAFEQLWNSLRDPHTHEVENTVLVAAAGNECTDNPFYPAASDWATGVGSLDHRADRVSDYSNYAASANVYLLGRNHINRFPEGHYTCRGTPDIDDERDFRSGWARWSGTSFSTPLLAGYLAAYISQHLADVDSNGNPVTIRQLRNRFLASQRVEWGWHAGRGEYYRYISSRNYPTLPLP